MVSTSILLDAFVNIANKNQRIVTALLWNWRKLVLAVSRLKCVLLDWKLYFHWRCEWFRDSGHKLNFYHLTNPMLLLSIPSKRVSQKYLKNLHKFRIINLFNPYRGCGHYVHCKLKAGPWMILFSVDKIRVNLYVRGYPASCICSAVPWMCLPLEFTPKQFTSVSN